MDRPKIYAFVWLMSLKTGSAWASLLIRNIWLVQHSMWLSRKVDVHPINTKDLDIDNNCANSDITDEFRLGYEPFPRRTRHLFYGRIKKILDKSLTDKIK